MKCIDIEDFMNFLTDDRKMFYSRLKKRKNNPDYTIHITQSQFLKAMKYRLKENRPE